MFNSPTAYCPRCREYVALDERRGDCVRTHDCTAECPLEKYFTAGKGSGGSRRVGEQPPADPPGGSA